MQQVFLLAVIIMAISALAVMASLPKILYLSLKKNLIDLPDARKRHVGAASRLGGVSFLPAMIISLFSGYAIANYVGIEYHFTHNFALVIVAVFLLYQIGLYDDVVGVGFKKKFAIQIMAAGIAIIAGVHLQTFYGFGTELILPFYLSIPLTILVIVFVTNALNLIDGMNGLASLIAILAFLVYGVLFVIYNQVLGAYLCVAALGALLPFFYCNVFRLRRRSKALLFMGDCGALVIGFILSTCAIKLWSIPESENIIISPDYNHVMAFTLLLVPCLDVVRIVIYRAKTGKPLFLPDNNHIHHKARALGFSDTHSLLFIVGIQLSFVLLNTLLAIYLNILLILAIDVVVWTLLHIIIRLKIKKKQNA